MDRLASVRRYREQALNAAALIAALATARLDGPTRLRDLADRQDDQLADLLHDFAYKARKAIELAIRAGAPIREVAEANSIMGIPQHESKDKAEDDDELGMYSLLFVLGRIIHSDHFTVERGQVPLNVGETVIHHEAPWGFIVRSDRDAPTASHFIFIEFLMERFLALDDHLQSYLKRAVPAQ
jgi:hypothetical protein